MSKNNDTEQPLELGRQRKQATVIDTAAKIARPLDQHTAEERKRILDFVGAL